jgi:uncharacterized protein YjbI with pentapeptide repeats
MVPIIIVVIIFSLLIVWFLPKYQLKKSNSDNIAKETSIDLENKLRQTTSQILGGLLLLSGAYLSYTSNLDLKFKQNTETLSNSLKQLNDTSMVMKLGSIYTLNKLASNSIEDRKIIGDIFVNYITDYDDKELAKKKNDVELILNLLANQQFDKSKIMVYNKVFKHLNLNNLDLSHTLFENCIFDSCQMTSIKFSYAILINTRFTTCKITSGIFDSSNIQAGSFVSCSMEHCSFNNSILLSTQFVDSRLQESDFSNALYGSCYESKNRNSASLRDSMLILYPKTTFKYCIVSNLKHFDIDTANVEYLYHKVR